MDDPSASDHVVRTSSPISLDNGRDEASSPMRKRPRLDSSASTAQGDPTQVPTVNSPSPAPTSSSTSTSDTHPGSSPVASKKKVVLNLRTPHRPAVHNTSQPLSVGMSSANGMRLPGQYSDQPLQYMDVTGEGPILQHNDPPVVDVKLDDEDSSSISGPEASETTLLARFPILSQALSPEASLARITEHLVQSSDGVHIDTLQELAAWMRAWVECLAKKPDSWRSSYSSKPALWTALGKLFARLVSPDKRPKVVASQYAGTRNSETLIDLLSSYLRLCGQMCSVDTERVLEQEPAAEIQGGLLHLRHYHNMHSALLVEDTLPLSNLLRIKYGLNIADVRRQIAEDTAQDPTYTSVFRLALSLASHLALGSQLSTAIPPCLSACSFLLYALRASQAQQVGTGEQQDVDPRQAFCEEISTSIARFNSSLLAAIDQQKPPVGADLLKSTVMEWKALLWEASLPPDAHLDAEGVARARSRCIDSMFPVYLRFIRQSRMGLRVFGTQELATCLVEVFHGRKEYGSACEGTVQRSIDFLTSNNVVGHVVGVESHPQLIRLSGNILGFALVFEQWTPEMTNAVFSTIRHGQDPEKVSAVLDTITNTLSHASVPALMTFLKETRRLPSSCFTQELVSNLVCGILNRLYEKTSVNAGFDAAELMQSMVQISVQTCNRVSAGAQIQEHQESLVYIISKCIADADTHFNDDSLRFEIVKTCAASLDESPETATGHVVAITSLVRSLEIPTLRLVVQDTVALEAACRDTIRYIALAKAKLSKLDFRFHWRLRLMNQLFQGASVSFVATELCSELWNSLVGSKAYSELFRDAGWKFFAELCTASPLFAGALLDAHLPSLPSCNFTGGTVHFAAVIGRRRWETLEHKEDEDGQIIPIPLEDIFWNLILQAPEAHLDMAEQAVKHLSAFYTDATRFARWPASSVSATHAALVEKTLTILRETAGQNKESDPHSHPDALRFTRTLKFLETFVLAIRSEPTFRTARPATQSPSPEETRHVAVTRGQVFTLRYQIFDRVAASELETLSVGRENTFAEVHNMLRELTPFGSMQLYRQGQRFDLMLDPLASASRLETTGLILIKNADIGLSEVVAYGDKNAATIAESTIAAHFDELYGYLGWKDDLDKAIFDFLSLFPVYKHGDQSTFAEPASRTDLFPWQKPYKMVYELRSLRRFLNTQRRDKDSARATAHQVTQFLLDMACSTEAKLYEPESPDSCWMALEFFTVTSHFLTELAEVSEPAAMLPGKETELVSILFQLILTIRHQKESGWDCRGDEITWQVCIILRCLILRDASFWEAFAVHERCHDVFAWLFAGHPNAQIRHHAETAVASLLHDEAQASAIHLHACHKVFWDLLAPIAIDCAEQGTNCEAVFRLLAYNLIPRLAQHDNAPNAGAARIVHAFLKAMVPIHLSNTIPKPTADGLIGGLAECARAALEAGIVPEKRLNEPQLRDIIFTRLLYPEISSSDAVDIHETPKLKPVMNDAARQSLFTLLLQLCRNKESIRDLLLQASHLVSEKPLELTFAEDKDAILRSSAGYSGLRNLTNTCYMNSLLAQLFMNRRFRDFILGVPSAENDSMHHRLLDSMKRLFASMVFSLRKYADTQELAESIEPYGGGQIDVSIQMDVDEFYNLLSDRLESQMPTAALKNEYRSIFGGELITQIKSMDCEHISGRTEPYMAISCDVKGKKGLKQSLESYVEGDTMEGDNKYKCESCGGRFVNAIKRTCLKQVPDSLVCHLKRFDFDVETMTRSKINDEFQFPLEIDMSPYKIETLDDTVHDAEPDMFELVGVLVHYGSAEAGHYYSYVRNPDGSNKWLQFNDIDVTEVDSSKLAEECFGGVQTFNGWTKQFNAYMLFYQRTHSPPKGPTIAKHRYSDPLLGKIQGIANAENDIAARLYCLMDQKHAEFIKSATKKLHALNDGSCPEDHDTETVVVEAALVYITEIASHTKDLALIEITWPPLEKRIMECINCGVAAVRWLTINSAHLLDLILHCPVALIRRRVQDLLLDVFRNLHNMNANGSFAGYGVNADATHVGGAQFDPNGRILPDFISALELPAEALGKACRLWDELLGLLQGIVELGPGEAFVLIQKDVLRRALLLMFSSSPAPDMSMVPHVRVMYAPLIQKFGNMKRPPSFVAVVRLVAAFLGHLQLPADLAILSGDERYLLTMGMTREEKDFALLSKAIDNWFFDEKAPFSPVGILSFLMEGASERDLVRVRITLSNLISEWLPDHNFIGIRISQEYFKLCREPYEGDAIIAAIVKEMLELDTLEKQVEEASDFGARMVQHEHARKGGMVALEFFSTVAQLPEKQDGELEDANSSFTAIVLSSLGECVAAILAIDEPNVTTYASEVVSMLLFEPLYQAVRSGARPTSLNLLRQEVIGIICNACRKSMARKMQASVPRTQLTAMFDMLEQCATWFRRHIDEVEFHEAWPVERYDPRRILQNFVEVRNEWNEYDVEQEDEDIAGSTHSLEVESDRLSD